MFGKRKKAFLTGIILTGLFVINCLNAQTAMQGPIRMDIRESRLNEQVISHILKITNLSDSLFNGTVQFNSSSEIKPLSRSKRPVNVAPGDSSFVAFKLVMGKDLSAGKKTLLYTLFNKEGKSVLSRELNIEIENRVHIHLLTDDTPVMLINPEDSVRINVTVNNFGNTREEATLVFNVPGLHGVSPFTEIKAVVEPMSQKSITYSFIPSSNLLSTIQFPVHVTAMRGSEKLLFGSEKVMVQNVFSSRRYSDINPMQSLFPGLGSYDNSVTLSYRQYNSSSNILELQAGGFFNLPAGYLQLKGNLYKYNSMQTPIVTNTSLMYKLYENEFTIGNLNEQMELPLFGRGAKMKFSDDKKSKTLTFGAIDQNYNLIGSQPWFSDYYSFYIEGEIGANNYDKGAKASYLFQKNPYEEADFHVGSLQWRTAFGNKWNIDLKAHGAIGKYNKVKGDKFSGAAELRYSGNISDNVTLNGSGYYSDGYFPGSRKGTISVSQGMNIKLRKDIYLNGSFSYNKTEPKSYNYNYKYQSENNNAHLSLSLPKISRISSSLYYRRYGERSSVYTNNSENDNNSAYPSMTSHRIGWQWRWQNSGVKHSLFGTVEAGFFNDPMDDKRVNQVKTSLNYSFQWLTMDLSYQKGAYYLYEYMMAKQQNKEFYRFTSSASVHKNISKKIVLTSGINFTRDSYQGNVPSVNLNAVWTPKENVALFLNGNWYRYPFINQKDMFNIQVGLTYTFKKTQPLSGKKSNVIARVYYDHNANSQYDEGDEPASGYLININENAFISDDEGKVRYTLVPFGEYTVKPINNGRWFFDQRDFEVKGFGTKLNIPLKQSGTLHGSIRYVSGDYSVDIVPRYEGFRFTITNADGSVTRTVVTDNKGDFITFLPQGVYTITLDKETLMEYTDCKNPVRSFQIKAGEITRLDGFEIEVKERKINVKRFFSSN